MGQVQRVGARATRYDHTPHQLPDGRWLATRQWTAYHGFRNVDHVRKVCEQQRRRWARGDREADEQPIEVLCTLHPVTRKRGIVLLDIDALADALKHRRFVEGKRRHPLEPE